jgi:hypothetical protein
MKYNKAFGQAAAIKLNQDGLDMGNRLAAILRLAGKEDVEKNNARWNNPFGSTESRPAAENQDNDFYDEMDYQDEYNGADPRQVPVPDDSDLDDDAATEMMPDDYYDADEELFFEPWDARAAGGGHEWGNMRFPGSPVDFDRGVGPFSSRPIPAQPRLRVVSDDDGEEPLISRKRGPFSLGEAGDVKRAAMRDLTVPHLEKEDGVVRIDREVEKRARMAVIPYQPNGLYYGNIPTNPPMPRTVGNTLRLQRQPDMYTIYRPNPPGVPVGPFTNPNGTPTTVTLYNETGKRGFTKKPTLRERKKEKRLKRGELDDTTYYPIGL